ncbi:uncharacterized protein UMAG_06509 [Mycosarcoma maydis]|uniref:Phenylalanine ammonia-lyase n=1 Tax=Mycosarcoma maydis TaxID=5270 RepID=A0A0D1CWV6_MYCMD|nr:uncharacterized protein UMAG_06509 [Ustilago maydis 521]KIS70888.1 hypothetical protein UMAG_06509 [Ustilago maydis 521]|eukprot:XP_011387946.1 hypothetical protein UMAG_06509 [Ustilago maydis 521]
MTTTLNGSGRNAYSPSNGHAAASSWLDTARNGWAPQSDLNSGITLDGSSLDLARLMGLVVYRRTPQLATDRREDMDASVASLESERKTENAIYGVNIPFGAGAYTTLDHQQLQQQQRIDRALITLINGDLGADMLRLTQTPQVASQASMPLPAPAPISAFGPDNSRLTMPVAWVRAAMVLRINSLLRAASGCRWEVVERLRDLLDRELYPVIPIRNSISASGDLSPLAYVAYAAAGSNKVQILNGATGKVDTADSALAAAKLEPVFQLRPREMLACINGTGACLAVSALALDRLQGLAFATHVVTAVMCEALLASPSFLDPYLHDVARPHPGQCESASILRQLLGTESAGLRNELLRHHDQDPLEFIWSLTAQPVLEQRFASKRNGSSFAAPTKVGQPAAASYLRQDRYHLRCAPQYIGPALEELRAAHDTVQIELNSVTDNPLLKPGTTSSSINTAMVHGGNFMASSVGHSAEQMRATTCTLGRLLHEQLTGAIDPCKSNGLPAYLAAYGADNPAMTGGLRSLDIASSSYLAELTFLGQRLIHLNRNAECGNQSVNSMALASARYTLEAVDLLTTMCASTLLAACQALDLRRLTVRFFRALSEHVLALLEIAGQKMGTPGLPADLQRDTLFRLFATWNAHWPVQLEERVRRAVEAALPSLAVWALTQVQDASSPQTVQSALADLDQGLTNWLMTAWANTMDMYTAQSAAGNAESAALIDLHHSAASLRILRFVRRDLGIPLDAGGGLQAMHSDKAQHAFATYGHSVSQLAAAFRDRRIDVLWHELAQDF